MARKQSDLERIRRGIYFAQRDIGDYQALRRSPGAYVRRRSRRYLTRMFFQVLRSLAK
jgi:hypothetical protein